jgi:acetyl-CoA carboxylase biotin carboxylase subunit
VRIGTLLVANRGEIARRVIRSAHAMGIRCAAVYVDADSDAPFVADADEALRLAEGYLDGKAILDAARAAGAQAIHPGYGFLSENAGFAADVIAAGLLWVGPSPDAISRMGDKLAAKALARELGVPTLPGAQDPAQAAELGYPLLVKAAAGGGGKGMRIVSTPEELAPALASARREAASGFGDERVFLERFVARCRHVEIQILGDAHGGLVHLGERECSIQRRHQKVIEECPSPRVDAALRDAMGQAALRLARALDYRSAGTVEFLLDDRSGEFFFLEVNTRLQVEHPVTEAITGIDLVLEQIHVASGAQLLHRQEDITFSGHAIECRINAENARTFRPSPGQISYWHPPGGLGVRVDSGVYQGYRIPPFYDSLIGKLIVHGKTRNECMMRLRRALSEFVIDGIETTIPLFNDLIRQPDIANGLYDIHWLEKYLAKS